MLKLKSLSDQAEALKIVLRQAAKEGKPKSEMLEISAQIKAVETLIYERKIMLKRQGLYEDKVK
jgi:hypothetical protein